MVLDGIEHTHIGGAHDAYVNLVGTGRTYANKFTRFQNAQKTHLGWHRQLTHLIQKDSTRIGLFKISFSCTCSPCEGTFLVAKQF